jgi:uncharacterized membrane protein
MATQYRDAGAAAFCLPGNSSRRAFQAMAFRGRSFAIAFMHRWDGCEMLTWVRLARRVLANARFGVRLHAVVPSIATPCTVRGVDHTADHVPQSPTGPRNAIVSSAG